MDLSKELLLNYKIDKDTIFLENFYKNNDKFNFYQFKYFNLDLNKEIIGYNNIDLITHYSKNNKDNNLISSIKEFYNIYPDFDLIFYKLIYSELSFDNDIQYLSYYHNIGKNQNNIYSFNSFKKKFNVDLEFIKIFYNIFYNKNDIEIIKYLLNNNNIDIYSEYIFNNKFPNFNITIYKLFNNNIYFINDILYKSHWYHIGKLNNFISSIPELIDSNNYFNYKLYKYLYNIDKDLTDNDFMYWYNNKDKLIYSTETLLKYLDDFNYLFFIKHYPLIKNKSKQEVMDFFVKNIDKINIIYSDKFFYLKYLNFNLNEYKIFNKTNSNNIINEYHNKLNKINIITSVNNFYIKFLNFNLEYYKNIIYIKNNIKLNNDNEYVYYWYHYDKNNYYLNENFYELYSTFNLNIYKYFNKNIVKNLDNKSILFDFKYKNRLDENIIYSFDTFYKNYPTFDKDIYKLFNNLNNYEDDELIVHFHSIGIPLKLIYNEKMIEDVEFSLKIYKELNKDLTNLSNKELIIHWYKIGKYQDRIYSIKSFYKKYPNINFMNNNNQDLDEDTKIIYWMNVGIYKYLKNKDQNIIGRNIVTNIYEVLIDLSYPYLKEKLEKGISLIIRAKNEEYNIKYCLESVVDLVDEIIFVDNNSTDNTYHIAKSYSEKYSNIKVYQYNINVAKVGIEHQNAINNDNKNTLGTFYNWCLSKATKYNVFKWDADFICIRNNFIKLVEKYNLRNRNDKFSIWFTGKTLFENNNKYYINFNSFYDEFRIFSYKNNFSWADGNTCEYTEPYLHSVHYSKKYKYIHPLFYELKRTSIDEFKERSSLIDSRDIKDFNILNNLKENNNFGLTELNNLLLNCSKTIILFTPSLSLGGGNQFIINIYNIYKSLGLNVYIVPVKNNMVGNNKYNSILEEDIININNFDIEFIKKINPEFILFNSDISFNLDKIILIANITKIFFVTHSDVAYANNFIEKYQLYFDKIITVNNYTITKLSTKLNIDKSKFIKLINYSYNNNIIEHKFLKKKFGLVSRFSEDKNIPMLIYSLKEFFIINNEYKFYFVGTNNLYYDNYLIYLCKINNIDKNIFFEGYQDDVNKYYNIFDFIVLPSVSEGCSYNIIEAMSFGLPVIASDVGGNHELITNNVNGILYSYDGIKELEKETIYIKNYNLHLSNIGYFINDDYLKNNFIIINNYEKIDVIIPFFVKCKNHNILNNECLYCNNIINKTELFNKNLKNISNSLKEIINYNQDKMDEIKINNINFIKDKFNFQDYSKQILELVNIS